MPLLLHLQFLSICIFHMPACWKLRKLWRSFHLLYYIWYIVFNNLNSSFVECASSLYAIVFFSTPNSERMCTVFRALSFILTVSWISASHPALGTERQQNVLFFLKLITVKNFLPKDSYPTTSFKNILIQVWQINLIFLEKLKPQQKIKYLTNTKGKHSYWHIINMIGFIYILTFKLPLPNIRICMNISI